MPSQILVPITYPTQNKWGKRLFDIAFSLLVLILGFPIFCILALVIKCTSKGPIFFKGLRLGKEGILISCWKFRTMKVGAKQQLEKILQNNAALRLEWETFYKLKKDPRVTAIGKFLRKTSLDELPQFLNVLKGDLSVVGPRPIEIYDFQNANCEIRERYKEKTDKILSVKPGITCIWQTCGRNLLTTQEQVVLEEKYIDSQSFWLDVQIICKTALLLFSSKGAY